MDARRSVIGRVLSVLMVIGGLAGAASAARAQVCNPGFVPHHVPQIGGKVYAMILFDDDNDGVPSVFIGGDAFTFGGAGIGGVAKLIGEAWVQPGSGFAGSVRAFAIREQGGVRTLVAGGSAVRAWDGATWTQVGGSNPGSVQSMAVFDDGGGPTLYVGGMFSTVNRLVGNTWAPTVPGALLTAGRVQSLVEFDADGPGGQPPKLYACGANLIASGQPCLIARFDAAGWTAVAPSISNWTKAMIRHDDGTGPKLYTTAHPSGGATGSPFTSNAQLASFDGAQWRGVATPPNMLNPMYSLVSFQERLGQPRVLWGQTDTQLLRAPDSGAAVFGSTNLYPPDYSQVTPLVLPPEGAGPECVLFPSGAGFIKLAGCPRLSADVTLDGVLNAADIFEYLGFWFAQNPLADFDHGGGLSASDIFAFLGAWFAGI